MDFFASTKHTKNEQKKASEGKRTGGWGGGGGGGLEGEREAFV